MTAKLTAAALLLVCLFLPSALTAGSDDEGTQLNIAVQDAKGRPVPKAAVTVSFISGRKMLVKKVQAEWNTKTNSRGVAELPEMPEGKVKLQVIAHGFRTYGGEFEVSGKEMTHTVKLERPKGQYSAHDEEEQPAPEKKP